MEKTWDCIVVGGGAAGLSAALVLGRARRRVLVLDAGEQSNLASDGIGGLIGQNGRPPAKFYSGARAEIAEHPTVELRRGRVLNGVPIGDGFALELEGGSREAARRVLLATGMHYAYPSLPGLEERWGGSVFHCPFCHGWEHRGQPLGLLARGPFAAHMGVLLQAWSPDVTVLSDGPVELDAEQRALLSAAGTEIDERPVASLHGPGAELTSVRFTDGTGRELGGLLVHTTLRGRDGLAARLGASTAQSDPVSTERIAVDVMGATDVPGLYVAGDLAAAMPSVANAIAAGSNAAAGIVQSLMIERASAGVAA